MNRYSTFCENTVPVETFVNNDVHHQKEWLAAGILAQSRLVQL
jgi:hypothetical protein